MGKPVRFNGSAAMTQRRVAAGLAKVGDKDTLQRVRCDDAAARQSSSVAIGPTQKLQRVRCDDAAASERCATCAHDNN